MDVSSLSHKICIMTISVGTSSQLTKQLDEQLFGGNRCIKYGQSISVDCSKLSASFDNCSTQTTIAIEIGQQEYCTWEQCR